ncbi:hypothetical protein [Aureimonas populi]|uniref:Phage holin n=1 Tax=Aureimonas populi TaxID=1701758 RepID=A0ABW5CGM7_9HYPH|nr:hypothetical protein [Aureimonas populi]
MQTALEILAPILATLASALVPILVAALVQWFRKLGIEIEANHRDALQSALTNAAMLALARGAGQNAPQVAIDYVKRSVPDAVKTFGLDNRRIAELLLPKITEAKVQAGKPVEPSA